MSLIFCPTCDHLFDSDWETDCPKCDEDGDDERAYAAERATEQAEIHNYPSEGPR